MVVVRWPRRALLLALVGLVFASSLVALISTTAPVRATTNGGVLESVAVGAGPAVGLNNDDEGRGVAVDGAGNTYVTGLFSGDMTLSSARLAGTGTQVSARSVVLSTDAGQSDLFTAKYDADLAVQWAAAAGRVAGVNRTDIGYDVAVDSAGNVITVGQMTADAPAGGFARFASATSSATGTLVSPRAVEVFGIGQEAVIAKYDASGVVQWATGFGEAGADIAYGVEVDAADNVIVVGQVNGAMTFRSATSSATGALVSPATVAAGTAGVTNIFVAKYSAAGEILWALVGDTAAGGIGRAVAVAPDGTVYFSGWAFAGATVFTSATSSATGALVDPSEVDIAVPGNNMVLGRIGANGAIGWVATVDAAGFGVAEGIAVRAADQVVATGRFTGATTFRSATASATGTLVSPATVAAQAVANTDAFVAQWSSAGVLQWMAGVDGGDANGEGGQGIGLDASGSALVAGFVRGEVVFRSATSAATSLPVSSASVSATAAGFGDGFVAKWSSSGQMLWASTDGGPSASLESAASIAVDSFGRSLVTGWFEDTALFSSATSSATSALISGQSLTVTSAGEADMFLARWSGTSDPPDPDPGPGPGGGGGAPSLSPPAPPVGSGPGGFTAIEPRRIVDTRTATPLAAGQTLRVALGGLIPVAATAVSINLTAVGAASPGYLVIAPCGAPASSTSILNVASAAPRPNAAIVAVGVERSICVSASMTTEVLVDLNGWFSAGLVAIDPARLYDSRMSAGTAVRSDSVVRVQVAGRGGLPTQLSAAALNITAVDAGAAGYVTVYACGARPETSNLNIGVGEVVATFVVTALSPTGEVCLYSSMASELVVDVFAGLSGEFVAVTPTRLLDTRVAGRAGRGDGWVDAASTVRRIEVPVAGRAGIPASARAVVVTLTAVDAESAGYAAVAPCTPNAPSTSTVNFGARATTSNTAVTALGAEGSLCVYASSAADYLVDVVGWLSTS